MPSTRAVLDTNVLVSALLFSTGGTSWLRGAWRSKSLLPLASRKTTQELLRVLCYPKFRLTEQGQNDLLADYLPWCETVAVPTRLPIPACRDPADRPFLELALAGRAEMLITGDRDLLALASTFSVPILSPNAARDVGGWRTDGGNRTTTR